MDANQAKDIYREWLTRTKPIARDDGLRHPLRLTRPYRPAPSAFYRPARAVSPTDS